ncbi:ribulose-phosphate 3-epimerase [Helicobacter monodelphidis]|uniref:ribulose-phosphate 3-epimerase n=1 Tax=Helicobacter sp. 15-1451 TaxID=2004995 RepID=UPI000DCC941D|nr:ribulose-phosphate 3-epimerase [Helicobacter sp. 15-1451]RAX57020.1 ribulose-phosphate 3-epimerase [Helicobacter sp. 15-1451]
MSTSQIFQVAPSLLAANFGCLNMELESIENAGADLVHIDIMDGHFVPNLTFGSVVLESMQTCLPLDIHLMVQNTAFFIEYFAPFKPRYISFHTECESHPHRLIQQIRALGISPAIALNPHTPIHILEYLIAELDMVLVMSVNPGFGGQKFLPFTLDKISAIRELRDRNNPQCLIEVDGGVNADNIIALKKAGINIAVAGNYIFKSKDYASAIAALKNKK